MRCFGMTPHVKLNYMRLRYNLCKSPLGRLIIVWWSALPNRVCGLSEQAPLLVMVADGSQKGILRELFITCPDLGGMAASHLNFHLRYCDAASFRTSTNSTERQPSKHIRSETDKLSVKSLSVARKRLPSSRQSWSRDRRSGRNSMPRSGGSGD